MNTGLCKLKSIPFNTWLLLLLWMQSIGVFSQKYGAEPEIGKALKIRNVAKIAYYGSAVGAIVVFGAMAYKAVDNYKKHTVT